MPDLISENGAYKVYAELAELKSLRGQFALRFLTEYLDSQNVDKQQKFIMFLNEDERKKLKDML